MQHVANEPVQDRKYNFSFYLCQSSPNNFISLVKEIYQSLFIDDYQNIICHGCPLNKIPGFFQ